MIPRSMGKVLAPYTPPNSAAYLSWRDRPSGINLAISKAFQAIACHTKSGWGFNGSDTYGIGGVKEHQLMRKIIQEGSSGTKDFYALDIGAGDYQWGRGLAHYLSTQQDLPKDVTIHIIGIRGERNLGQAVTDLGQCRLYEFGQFQIETLMDEFQQRDLPLASKVDLVVSSWCFRHLVDPVGTFTQAYDLLRPQTGHMLFDGFFFLHENEAMRGKLRVFNEKMIRLCLETRAPFLTRYHDGARSLDHFVMNRPDDRPCQLFKKYLGMENLSSGWEIGSEAVTRFKALEEPHVKMAPLRWEGEYRGCRGMYESLRQNGLLYDSDVAWGPL